MTVRINKVKKGPQDDGSFGADSQYGETFVTAWLCDVDVDGSVFEAKVRVGSKSAGTNPPLAKYIEAGTEIVPNKQGIKDYKGMKEIYLDSKATKDVNGDAFGGGGGSTSRSSHAGSPQNVSQPKGNGRGDKGMAIGCALNNAVKVAIDEKGKDGEVDLDRVEAVATRLMAIEEALAGGKPPVTDDVWTTIEAALKSTGMKDQFDAGDVTKARAIEIWGEANGNATAFGIVLKNELAPPAEDEDGASTLPF